MRPQIRSPAEPLSTPMSNKNPTNRVSAIQFPQRSRHKHNDVLESRLSECGAGRGDPGCRHRRESGLLHQGGEKRAASWSTRRHRAGAPCQTGAIREYNFFFLLHLGWVNQSVVFCSMLPTRPPSTNSLRPPGSNAWCSRPNGGRPMAPGRRHPTTAAPRWLPCTARCSRSTPAC